MGSEKVYERMLDKSHIPSNREISVYLGTSACKAWDEMVSFLKVNYKINPVIDFGGAKYGWSVRYRKGGKSLCTLFPEKGAFTILIVLGKKEVEEVEQSKETFTHYTSNIFKSARQYHDGRWLWIRIEKKSEIKDIKHLLLIKRKPL